MLKEGVNVFKCGSDFLFDNCLTTIQSNHYNGIYLIYMLNEGVNVCRFIE